MNVKFRFKSGEIARYTDLPKKNVAGLRQAFELAARLNINNSSGGLTCIDMSEVVEMNVYEC